MPVRVLIVDDSSFFRRQITRILEADPQIKVVGTASDGKEAIAKVVSLKPDVITMDVEMPVMDGIVATREIMNKRPTPILMFSSVTTEGAQPTLDALDAGAVDFLPKRFQDLAGKKEEAGKVLCERVRVIARTKRAPGGQRHEKASRTSSTALDAGRKPASRSGKVKLVAIGTSTGGPIALQTVLAPLPATFPVPILLIQHMPGTFTPAFAKRLDQLCAISVKEAEDGDHLQAATAYLAPGGKQMTVRRQGKTMTLHIEPALESQTYKPSVDITFSSVADHYPGSSLAIVLTGMGADGCEGAKRIHRGGSPVWAQDEVSSVVYGMPAAVNEAGIADRVLPLKDVAKLLVKQL